MTTNILLIFALYIPRPRSSRVLWRMRQPKRSSGYGFLPAIWSHAIAGWQLWGASPRSVASSFFLRLAGIQSNTWWARLCEGGGGGGGGRSAWPNHWRDGDLYRWYLTPVECLTSPWLLDFSRSHSIWLQGFSLSIWRQKHPISSLGKSLTLTATV